MSDLVRPQRCASEADWGVRTRIVAMKRRNGRGAKVGRNWMLEGTGKWPKPAQW